MKAITINSMPVLVGLEVRHGTISLKCHRGWWAVEWSVYTLDKCVALSDSYLSSSYDHQWLAESFRASMEGCGKHGSVQGSLRWGHAKGLTLAGAQKLVRTINQKWAELILRWMEDGSPATKRPKPPLMRAGLNWGVE